MFAQRVAQPIMRMAQLWTDFQQTGISMARLGDILNTPHRGAAQQRARSCRRSRAASRFDARHASATGPRRRRCCNGVSLDVRAGRGASASSGRSGSGKSTLTKLVQRLYVPEQGRVLVDGIDISLIDAAQLRRQIGVVLQENLLFNRSVRENIAIADPAAPHRSGDARRPSWPARTSSSASCPRATTPMVGEQGGTPVRRPAPAHRHRARAVHQSAHPDLRRGHQRARLRERGHHPDATWPRSARAAP